ncbi:MAG: cytochrome c [Acidobacteria bacterium]|nr:cytochrome c [Acidobacteriota bacterium]
MKTTLKIVAIVGALSIALAVIACGSTSGSNASTANNTAKPNSAAPTPAASATPDAMAASRDLYKTNCAKCHQDNGKGGKVTVDGKTINAHDLTSDKMKKRDDDKFADDIKEGSPDDGMPAFKDKLSDAQINDIIKYIRAELQK